MAKIKCPMAEIETLMAKIRAPAVGKCKTRHLRGREWLAIQLGRQILVQGLDDRVDEPEQIAGFPLFGLAINRCPYRYGLSAGSIVAADRIIMEIRLV